MDSSDQHDRALLQRIARAAMLERGLLPDFSPAVRQELERIRREGHADPPAGPDSGLPAVQAEGAPADPAPGVDPTEAGDAPRDLRALLWCSIDNDDSLDLDQLTVAEELSEGRVRVLVAVADVNGLVKKGSAIDEHAGHNTTSVYTAAQIFPMLPLELSNGLTSLNGGEERAAVIVDMVVAGDGSMQAEQVYRGLVMNRAKLAYNAVAAWLEGTGPQPEAIGQVPGLAENLRVQDRAAQAMKNFRHVHGALSLETIQARPVFAGDRISGLERDERNRAKDIVEDFMIGANGVTARYLAAQDYPSIRRVVRTPDRWDRIAELAAQHGGRLPQEPDAKALEDFLAAQRAADPLRFPDLSLAVVKLLGPGEYVAELPGETAPGHFGLATKDYGHSTAPNRRYTDLVTQRLLKAAIAGRPSPYDKDELQALADHCTTEENAAQKVERQVAKSAAALLLGSRIGEEFDGLVTGAAPKGTWVRLLAPPVEGRVEQGAAGLDVGDRVRVRLLSVDVERGFIDFARVGRT